MRLLLLLSFFFLADICLAENTPYQIAGFRLGADIQDFKEKLQEGSALPIRHMESVKEMEIVPTRLYKSGLVAYSGCDAPGKVIRIKLKYAEASREFYEQLLERFKRRFGEPAEWRGDPFRVVLAWKWSFQDDRGNRISLILQHNTEDRYEKMGNAVKLTQTSQWEKELDCLEGRKPDRRRTEKEPVAFPKRPDPKDWELMVPK